MRASSESPSRAARAEADSPLEDAPGLVGDVASIVSSALFFTLQLVDVGIDYHIQRQGEESAAEPAGPAGSAAASVARESAGREMGDLLHFFLTWKQSEELRIVGLALVSTLLVVRVLCSLKDVIMSVSESSTRTRLGVDVTDFLLLIAGGALQFSVSDLERVLFLREAEQGLSIPPSAQPAGTILPVLGAPWEKATVLELFDTLCWLHLVGLVLHSLLLMLPFIKFVDRFTVMQERWVLAAEDAEARTEALDESLKVKMQQGHGVHVAPAVTGTPPLPGPGIPATPTRTPAQPQSQSQSPTAGGGGDDTLRLLPNLNAPRISEMTAGSPTSARPIKRSLSLETYANPPASPPPVKRHEHTKGTADSFGSAGGDADDDVDDGHERAEERDARLQRGMKQRAAFTARDVATVAVSSAATFTIVNFVVDRLLGRPARRLR